MLLVRLCSKPRKIEQLSNSFDCSRMIPEERLCQECQKKLPIDP
jgi:hypothetical protein